MAGQREQIRKTEGQSKSSILGNKPYNSVWNAITGTYDRQTSVLGGSKGSGQIGQSLKDYMLSSADTGSATDIPTLQKFATDNLKKSGEGKYQITLNGRDTVWLVGGSPDIDSLKVVDYESWKKAK
jgi:hypothetical protein